MKQKHRNTKESQRPAPEYEVQIPTREEILKSLEAADAPRTFKAIVQGLGVGKGAAEQGLRRRLRAMVRDGQLIETRSNRYGVAKRMELIAGRVIGHPDGFAFIRPDEGNEDIYVARSEARQVLHGDRVLVRIAGLDQRDRPYGNIVEVLARANTEVVGRYSREGRIGLVIPDNRNINQDVLIPEGQEADAKSGQIVVAVIEQQPDLRHQPVGRISEVLGDHMAPGMEVDMAIRTYGLPTSWSEGVEREAKTVPGTVDPAACSGRQDLRSYPFVTIDGIDARDFDDAVFCRKRRDGYTLYVAIADVAHYVRPGTALDGSAHERGTSVYFPDRVIPMLPEVLSNGICSLNPAVDRLALVCELRLDADGAVEKSRFYNAVIRSQARLTYEEVGSWLEAPEIEVARDSVRAHVMVCYELYQRLRLRREERGALDIDTIEPRFIFDANRKIERVESRVRNEAHKLIEECMIIANVAAAEYLLKHQCPAVFRIHAGPDGEKLNALRQFLGELGLSLPGGDKPEAKHFAHVLRIAHERPDRHLIETVLMRSLKLAVYSPDNIGHFGLALAAYTHFTSPIRRYPDLIVHRAIKARLQRQRVVSAPEEQAALGEHCSMTERRADEATRDAVLWLKCEYMSDKVGDFFEGIISSVTSFGLFVQLDEIFIEGLVHVTSLPEDYYQFDAIGHRLVGRATRCEYRVGQKIRVQVARVSLDDRKIDLIPGSVAPAPRKRCR